MRWAAPLLLISGLTTACGRDDATPRRAPAPTGVDVALERAMIKPKGRTPVAPIAPAPVLSILVTDRAIFLGATGLPGATWTDTIELAAGDRAPTWRALDDDLVKLKRDHFRDRTDLELAAAADPAHPIKYADLIAVMDHAVSAGFTDVGLVDPQGLTWHPAP